MKNLLTCALFAFIAIALTGCADPPPCETVSKASEHGFLWGLAHGLVMPIALLGKLFGFEYGLYAANNTGFWYWLGYFIGFGGLTGGIFGSRKSK